MADEALSVLACWMGKQYRDLTPYCCQGRETRRWTPCVSAAGLVWHQYIGGNLRGFRDFRVQFGLCTAIIPIFYEYWPPYVIPCIHAPNNCQDIDYTLDKRISHRLANFYWNVVLELGRRDERMKPIGRY